MNRHLEVVAALFLFGHLVYGLACLYDGCVVRSLPPLTVAEKKASHERAKKLRRGTPPPLRSP